MFTNLSETPETPQPEGLPEMPATPRPPTEWRRRLGRIGCAILLIPWFALMLTPCLVLTLAIQREITLTHSDLPNHAFRLWLLQERDAQGLAVVTSRRVEITTPEPLACVVYDVRFFLWGGDAEKAGAKPVHSCECFARSESTWRSRLTGDAACRAAE